MHKEDYCNRCGMCCRAIRMKYSIDYIKEILSKEPDNYDAKFIVENWTPISIEQAYEINAILKKWTELSEGRGEFYYKCAQFDEVNNICKIHITLNNSSDTKQPDICIRYPFYGRDKLPIGEQFYSENCGYNRDDLKELQK